MSFSGASPNRAAPVFPLVSMIDVLFLLLIFFLTISVMRDEDTQIEVSLPPTQHAQEASTRTQIVLTVSAEGHIFMGDVAYEPQALTHVLKQLAVQFPDESVVIRADQNSRTGDAVRVLELVQSSGLRNVFLATRQTNQP